MITIFKLSANSEVILAVPLKILLVSFQQTVFICSIYEIFHSESAGNGHFGVVNLKNFPEEHDPRIP